jgi:excinuclease ABC subunit B
VNPTPRRDGDTSRISDTYEPVQPTYAQSSSQPAPSSRVKKPSLDDMGPGTDRPIPARDPKIDPRVKAGAFGEQVRGPHKPTLDEMGPHASLAVKKASGSLPQKPDLMAPKPTRTVEFDDPAEVKGRKGRPRKTGRPGR